MTDDTSPEMANAPFKSQLSRWLFSQAASTVLLVLLNILLAYGAYKGVPYVLERIDQMHREARADFKVLNDNQAKSMGEMREAMDKNTECLRELKSAIK